MQDDEDHWVANADLDTDVAYWVARCVMDAVLVRIAVHHDVEVTQSWPEAGRKMRTWRKKFMVRSSGKPGFLQFLRDWPGAEYDGDAVGGLMYEWLAGKSYEESPWDWPRISITHQELWTMCLDAGRQAAPLGYKIAHYLWHEI